MSSDSSNIIIYIRDRGKLVYSEVISIVKNNGEQYTLFSSKYPESYLMNIYESQGYRRSSEFWKKIKKKTNWKVINRPTEYLSGCQECYWRGDTHRFGDTVKIESLFFGKEIIFECKKIKGQPFWDSEIYHSPYPDKLDINKLCVSIEGTSPGALIEETNNVGKLRSVGYTLAYKNAEGKAMLELLEDEKINSISKYLNDNRFETDSLKGKWKLTFKTYSEFKKGIKKNWGSDYYKDTGELEFYEVGDVIKGKIIYVSRGIAKNIPFEGKKFENKRYIINIPIPKRPIILKVEFDNNNSFRGNWEKTDRRNRTADIWAYVIGSRGN